MHARCVQSARWRRSTPNAFPCTPVDACPLHNIRTSSLAAVFVCGLPCNHPPSAMYPCQAAKLACGLGRGRHSCLPRSCCRRPLAPRHPRRRRGRGRYTPLRSCPHRPLARRPRATQASATAALCIVPSCPSGRPASAPRPPSAFACDYHEGPPRAPSSPADAAAADGAPSPCYCPQAGARAQRAPRGALQPRLFERPLPQSECVPPPERRAIVGRVLTGAPPPGRPRRRRAHTDPSSLSPIILLDVACACRCTCAPLARHATVRMRRAAQGKAPATSSHSLVLLSCRARRPPARVPRASSLLRAACLAGVGGCRGRVVRALALPSVCLCIPSSCICIRPTTLTVAAPFPIHRARLP